MDDSIRRAKLKRLDQIREQKKVHLKDFIQKRMKQDPENIKISRSHTVGLPLKSGTWLHSRRNPFQFLKTIGHELSEIQNNSIESTYVQVHLIIDPESWIQGISETISDIIYTQDS